VNAYPRAGPKAELHFEPREVRAAIVNCGGLCPGLNNAIKGIVASSPVNQSDRRKNQNEQ